MNGVQQITNINGFGGAMARKILAVNGDFKKLRKVRTLNEPAMNGTLLKDEWKLLDDAVAKAMRSRLIGVNDLINAGLTLRIPNGLGVMTLESERAGTMGDATMSMSASAKATKDRITFDLVGLPLPVTMCGWGYELRVLMASQRKGVGLDTTNGEESGRAIAEKIEDVYFNGSGDFSFAGNTIYGLCDFPDRNEFDLSGDWSAPGTVETGEPIIQDILAGVYELHEAKFFGPYMLYVPTNYYVRLSDDYKAASDKSILSRILEMPFISGVKPADKLIANNVVLVQMTSDVVRLVIGQDVITVDWEEEGGYDLNYKTLTITVPQIRSDKNGNCGVAHGTIPG
jgi:uncharacterized linocin/CFP29 family protein